jgi:hypothetical protein
VKIDGAGLDRVLVMGGVVEGVVRRDRGLCQKLVSSALAALSRSNPRALDGLHAGSRIFQSNDGRCGRGDLDRDPGCAISGGLQTFRHNERDHLARVVDPR